MRRVICIAAAVAVTASQAAAAAPSLRVYEGSGTRTLAPFRLTHPATLRWQTSGGLIVRLFTVKLLNTRADIPSQQLIVSTGRSGSVQLRPGPYTLRVTTSLHWKITIG